jgi:hypothetical protein
MKTPCIFQVRSTGSCATVRTLGQASPISTQSWISVDTIREVSARHSDAVVTRLDATQLEKLDLVSGR